MGGKKGFKRVLLWIFVVFVLLFFASKIYHSLPGKENKKGIVVPPVSTLQKIEEKHVMTDFYYWYDLPSGVHSTSLTDYPKDKNTSFRNVAWFKKQFSDMNEAGVDIALLVYWSRFEDAHIDGLKNMVNARKELLNGNQKAPKIGLFLDTGVFGRVDKKGRNLLADYGKENFYSYIREFFQNVPMEDVAKINNKPVIALWGNYFNVLFDQSSFDYIYENYEKDFGVKPYIIRDVSWNYPLLKSFFGRGKPDFLNPIKTDDVYSWGAALNGYQDPGGNVVSVGPGYDERELEASDRSGRYVLRKDGNWYTDNFQKALNTNKPIVMIETWNEFHEASDIAESEEYGRQYILLTKKMTDKFWKMK